MIGPPEGKGHTNWGRILELFALVKPILAMSRISG
jgi:hypothetical protein